MSFDRHCTVNARHQQYSYDDARMSEIDYNEELRGFVERGGGIPLQEWLDYARDDSRLEKQPPQQGINPFTQQPCEFPNNNFYLLAEGRRVGLICWEEAECLGIAGSHGCLAEFAESLCRHFDAQFQALDE